MCSPSWSQHLLLVSWKVSISWRIGLFRHARANIWNMGQMYSVLNVTVIFSPYSYIISTSLSSFWSAHVVQQNTVITKSHIQYCQTTIRQMFPNHHFVLFIILTTFCLLLHHWQVFDILFWHWCLLANVGYFGTFLLLLSCACLRQFCPASFLCIQQ